MDKEDQRKSSAHNDHFLKRSAREEEALRREVGSKVVDRLDRVSVRDVLHARRRRELEDLLDVPEAERRPHELHVMVNLASGRRSERGAEDAFQVRLGPARKAAPPAVTRMERRRRTRARGIKAVERFTRAMEDQPVKVEKTLWLTHSAVVRMPPEHLFQVASRADVSRINHTKRVFATALDASRPLINVDDVETALGFTGANVTVAVIDTGVDFNHPALVGSMGSQQDLTGEGVGDLHGHGTHCAGVVGSRDTTRRGMAPAAMIHDIKIMDQFGGTDAPTAVSGLQQAAILGVHVASNSWGFSHADGNWVCAAGDCVLCVAADNAVVNGGVIVVVAAGNEDNDTCATYDTHLRCPANAREVITVAASNDSDGMADFSSLGPTPDGRAKPDVTAPGVDIGSARSTTGSDMNGGASPIDANWIDASGTSMACPHVAGVCALMMEKTSTLTPADVKAALMRTAIDIGATADEMGAGRIDALAAVDAV